MKYSATTSVTFFSILSATLNLPFSPVCAILYEYTTNSPLDR